VSDYTKSTNFATKDTLSPGSALKIVRGTEIDTEFNAISTAIATKADTAAPTFTTSIATPIVKSASTLKLQTNGTTDAIIIDTAQNVGVGVTPSAWNTNIKTLQLSAGSVYSFTTVDLELTQNCYYNASNQWIYSTTAPAERYQLYNGTHAWYTAASGTAGNTISFTQAMTLDASSRLIVGATAVSGSNQVEIQTSLTNGLWVQTGQTSSSYYIADFRNGSNQSTLSLRADNTTLVGGNLLVGTTSSPTGGAVSTWQNSGSTRWSMGPNGGSAFVVFNTSNVGCYVVDGQTGWTGTSDGTLKNVIAPITNGLALISELKPTTYSWKADEENKPYAGLIAQEVQTVLPNLVNDANGTLGVNYTGVIPYLISAIQEQQATITALTARITALEQA
jgi:hypothetical protein